MTIAELSLVLLTATAVSLSQANPVAEAEKSPSLLLESLFKENQHAFRSKRDAVREAGLSKTEQENIVSRHNGYRSKVSPSASNMVPLKWNDNLASKAQKWASKCTFTHDTYAQRATSDFGQVGQNVAYGYGYSMNDYMDSWNEEKKYYDLNSNKCSAECGHYTQVVWATTTDIGCGWAACPIKNKGTFDYLVCNYGPAGNVNNAPPYTSGGSCTGCPNGYSGGCKSNLCTAS